MQVGGAGAGGGDAADIRGRHRIQAELKKLEQEARFLEVCVPACLRSLLALLPVPPIPWRANSSGFAAFEKKKQPFSIVTEDKKKLSFFASFLLAVIVSEES